MNEIIEEIFTGYCRTYNMTQMVTCGLMGEALEKEKQDQKA